MNRGRFAYFGTIQKRLLYTIGKKNFDSYRKPTANFIGRFVDFKVPFYEDYLKLKRETLLHILESPQKSISNVDRVDVIRELIKNNQENKNKLTHKQLADLFMSSVRTIQRYIADMRNNGEY